MKINWKTIGLKGQDNIAQGNALGIGECGNEIVRAKASAKEQFIFRTKLNQPSSFVNAVFGSVRMMVFFLANIISRTDLPLAFLPGALPRAEICWPFRPISKTLICV